MRVHQRSKGRVHRWLPYLGVALLVHLLLGYSVGRVLPRFAQTLDDSTPLAMVVLQPPPDQDEEDDEDELDLEGQLVETAKPKQPERPEDAEYLAEHDTTVEVETRSELFKINPEVVAPQYSDDERMEYEALVDLNVDQPSTGAQPGNERFDPDRDGSFAALRSPWTLTNRQGLQDPVPASHQHSLLAGAPQNDLLLEERGEVTQLNTKDVLFASYLLRIRRLVNFYWEQNLDNLPRSVRIAKPRYTTGVLTVLDGNGSLEEIVVAEAAGVRELDDCVVRAYKLAGPFPNPPEQLIAQDGRVYLPSMSWTVTFTAALNQYRGIDPNAGNQFPGLLKSPR
jgi:hypothetical protein